MLLWSEVGFIPVASPPDIFRILPEFWYVGERESGVEKDADAAFEE